MTKTEQARIVAWRVRIHQHAASLHRHVAQTCQYFGISRTALYRWEKRFDEHGEAGTDRNGDHWLRVARFPH